MAEPPVKRFCENMIKVFCGIRVISEYLVPDIPALHA